MLETRYEELAIDGRYAAGDLGSGKYVVTVPRVASTSVGQWLTQKQVPKVEPRLALQGQVATFVRNPYDRLVSAHAFLWSHMAFEDFVWCLERNFHAGAFDVHFAPQVMLIGGASFVGLREHMTRDWQRFCEWAGLEFSPLPVSNASLRMPAEMYYSPRLRDLVATLYREDFETYGYSTRLEARRSDS